MFRRLLASRNGHNEPVVDPAEYARVVAERDYWRDLAIHRSEIIRLKNKDVAILERIVRTFFKSAPWYQEASFKVVIEEICARLLWFCEEPVRATTNGGW